MNVLYQKTPFETYRNINLIYIFPKGLAHGFCQKFEIFLFFLFRQNEPIKSVYERFISKKCISRLQKDMI